MGLNDVRVHRSSYMHWVHSLGSGATHTSHANATRHSHFKMATLNLRAPVRAPVAAASTRSQPLKAIGASVGPLRRRRCPWMGIATHCAAVLREAGTRGGDPI